MHLHEERRVYTGEPTELVCQCLKVERRKIDETIETINATTVSQVRRKCKAGGGCGSCHEEIARLILSRHFRETLDFGNQPDHEHDLAEELLPDHQIDDSLAAQVKNFIDQQINPRLALLDVTARITEIGEEVVLELTNADEELKYTLSFWLEFRFAQQFAEKITTIIA